MGFISDLTPLNRDTEKEKFFNDYSYNPQFTYNRVFTKQELTQWGLPREDLYQHALTILEKNPIEYSQYKQVVSQETVITEIEQLLEKLKIPDQLAVEFEHDRITRCGITNTAIKFRVPLTYSHTQLVGVLHHEIETHFLRKLNNNRQPWAGQSRPDHIFRSTEEGLAKLHSYLDSDDKIMKQTFCAYIAVYLAQTTSFSQVFDRLTKLGLQPERAWFVTIIAKRGLTDTAQPGGITKTVTYIDGALRVLRWLLNETHDPHRLYWGRIDVNEIEKLADQAQTTNLHFPTFFADIPEYRGKITAITDANEFGKFL